MTKKNKTILTIILARKGSKRLKNKNLKKINNESLSEITIKFAIKLKKYSIPIISTNDRRIIKIAEKYNLINPGLRPINLSQDNSSSFDVIKYLVKWYQKKFQVKVNGVILLQPTSPFRKVNLLINSIKIFSKNKYKFNYVSISSTKLKNNMFINKNKILSFPKSLEKANCYLNGNFYILNPSFLKSKTIQTIIKSKTIGILIKSKKYSLDIDDYKNLKQARVYAKL